MDDAKTQIEFFMKGKQVVVETVDVKYENVFRYLQDVKRDAFDSVKQISR